MRHYLPNIGGSMDLSNISWEHFGSTGILLLALVYFFKQHLETLDRRLGELVSGQKEIAEAHKAEVLALLERQDRMRAEMLSLIRESTSTKVIPMKESR